MAQPNGTSERDLLWNVAHLLKGPVGGSQRIHLDVTSLPLGENREARDLHGDLKLTKLDRGILINGQLAATVELTCMRCLEEYRQPVAFDLVEEFRPMVDVTSGSAVAPRDGEEEQDFFPIGEDHVLNLSDALRQAIWLATPMVPLCREDCAGIPLPGNADDAGEEPVDDRFAVLANLLKTDTDRQRPRR